MDNQSKQEHKRFRRYHVRTFMSEIDSDKSPYWDFKLGQGRGKLTSVRKQNNDN